MAENKVNILTINQVILDGIFNMAMIVDMDNSDITLDTLQDLLKQKGDAWALKSGRRTRLFLTQCIV